MDVVAETQRALQALRDRVEDSDLTQATIEARAGLTRGYLGQVLRGHIELKLWQVLAIVAAIGVTPDRFFADLYPRRILGRGSVARRPPPRRSPLSRSPLRRPG